jgi:hypothetical protein
MVHPYKVYSEDTSIENMDLIEATLHICTLYNGVPHGLAYISYEVPKDEKHSFEGIGIFIDGVLHNSPFTWVRGD